MAKKIDVTTGKTVNYEYDSLGRLIHSYQTNNGTIQQHTEHLCDTENRLVSQTWTSGSTNHVMDFVYDNTGKPYALKYDGTTYYYVLNLQGDVISIITHWGESYGSYTYDAWGNVIAQSGSIASINPIRYRGYYYDSETGLYYLGSRYYDPAIGRFVNADGYASTGQGLIGHNMFAYCLNNPVYYSDSTGHRPHVFSNFKKILRRVPQALNNAARKIGINTAALGAPSLNMYKDSKGIYHAKSNCWQKNFGYCSFYDAVFDTATYMEAERFDFTSGGTSYTLWAWKGNYINLGAGAEMGLYTGGGWMVSANHNITPPMTMSLTYDGSTIIDHSDTTWWITGFNPNYLDVREDQLTATFTVDFSSHPGMFYDFSEAYKTDSRWAFDPQTYLASFRATPHKC